MTGFAPADEATAEWHRKMKLGQVVQGKYTKVRNYLFLKKYMALLSLAFSYWEPGDINSEYGAPEKSFERFRKDLQILAGRFHIVIRLDGSTRVESDSISFAKMSEEEFERLYQDVLTVVMKKILTNMEKSEIDGLVDKFLQFA